MGYDLLLHYHFREQAQRTKNEIESLGKSILKADNQPDQTQSPIPITSFTCHLPLLLLVNSAAICRGNPRELLELGLRWD